MAVGYKGLPELPAIAGFRLGIASAVSEAWAPRFVVMELSEGCEVAAVFTRNAFCAAPVTLAKDIGCRFGSLSAGHTGNANAGTGAAGMVAAEECCTALAAITGATAQQICPSPPVSSASRFRSIRSAAHCRSVCRSA